jgi:prolyl oligopeptidase
MHKLIEPSPLASVEAVTDIHHGVPVSDPYRWLEEQDSPQTRAWLQAQTRSARDYLDRIPGRERIRKRVQDLLDVETIDSILCVGSRYIFRKRLRGEQQAGIYMRENIDGVDELLVNPAERNTGPYTAVNPMRLSRDKNLLLYEVKHGGERSGTFEILDIATRRCLPDSLPHGYLRGFEFAPDGTGFYFVHEQLKANPPRGRSVYRHFFGTPAEQDHVVFSVQGDANVRLSLTSGPRHLLIFVYHLLAKILSDIYLQPFDSDTAATQIFHKLDYTLDLRFANDCLFALTDRDAPNRRIVQIDLNSTADDSWKDVIPERPTRIESWLLSGRQIVVSFRKHTHHYLEILDLGSDKTNSIPVSRRETLRLVPGSLRDEEFLVEVESFTEPLSLYRCSTKTGKRALFARRVVPFDAETYDYREVSFMSTDGVRIPMFLVGRRDILEKKNTPVIMTSYGGFGVAMTPQFSVFVTFLMERGCLFALPLIRGGGEFGKAWRDAGRRRNRPTAYRDFVAAAEWLIRSERCDPQRLAIFGGSNSGLLVNVALTMRPELFRAVVCMVPILDMLRYHLFDSAITWREEFGTADDPDDFRVLLSYSPYHNVRAGTAYPATMIVSGDADQTCNPLHARKMTARLQAANASDKPIVIAYSPHRGHSAVLPLSERIEALTDRMAFLCDQLQLPV